MRGGRRRATLARVSARRTERLVNLVICLLSTRRYLTAAQIREAVTSYADAPTDEAFRRTFERDKEDLRELGIPLETGTNSAADDEVGYRIARRDYELPPLRLEPDEAAAVALAVRLWRSATLAEPASRGWLKLRAADPTLAPELPLADVLDPRVTTPEPAFAPLLEATRRARRVRFDYRPMGADRPATRNVDPWGVVSWRGHWYLVGHDHDRGAERVFRLARIVGEVRTGEPTVVAAPEGFDLVAAVAAVAHEQPTREARLRLAPGRALDLRREGEPEPQDPDLVTVPFADPDRLAARLAGYGADVTVEEPKDLREAVIARLRQAAATR